MMSRAVARVHSWKFGQLAVVWALIALTIAFLGWRYVSADSAIGSETITWDRQIEMVKKSANSARAVAIHEDSLKETSASLMAALFQAHADETLQRNITSAAHVHFLAAAAWRDTAANADITVNYLVGQRRRALDTIARHVASTRLTLTILGFVVALIGIGVTWIWLARSETPL
jgi:hypothetical protein